MCLARGQPLFEVAQVNLFLASRGELERALPSEESVI
jgi:hypothetical protein